MLGPTIIIDDEINVRGLESNDTQFWLKWNNDPIAQEYMPEPFEEQTLGDVEKLLIEVKNEEDAIYWAIEDRSTQKPIGIISLTQINHHHGLGEIGIIIGEVDYHGKGIATKAIFAILKYSKEQGLRRITAEYEEGNIGMQKALEKS